MKQKIFSNLLTGLVLLVGLLAICLPTNSLAINRKTGVSVPENSQATFCSKLSSVSNNITSRMAERESDIKTKQNTRLTDLKSKRADRGQKRDDSREYWDKIRADKYAELEAFATTDEQKQAVETFKNTIEGAVKARKGAIDAAISRFQNDVDSVVLTRKNSVDQAVTNYKNSVQTALAKAQTDCTAGNDPATVRSELKNNLETARTTLQTERANIDKISDNIGTYVTTRKVAVEAAWTAFKTTAQAAKEELKKVLE